MTLIDGTTLDEIADRPELARKLDPPVARAMRWKALRALLALGLAEQDQEPTGTAIVAEDDREIGMDEAAQILGRSRGWLEKRENHMQYGSYKVGARVRFSLKAIRQKIARQAI